MWWLIVFEKATETPVIDLVKNGEGITPHPPSPTGTSGDGVPKEAPPIEAINEKAAVVTNKGKLLMDTTVHLFIGMKPACCLSNLVMEIKKSSNSFIKEKEFAKQFHWQDGLVHLLMAILR